MTYTETIYSIVDNYSKLHNGHRSTIRRANRHEDLIGTAAARLCTNSSSEQELRVLFLAPFIELDENGRQSLGSLFYHAGIKEKRLNIELSSFKNIRRLLVQSLRTGENIIHPKALIEVLFWKQKPTQRIKTTSKQQIVRDYFVAEYEQ